MNQAVEASRYSGLGRTAVKLLYDVARFGAPYPLAFQSYQAIAPRLIAVGLMVADADDQFLVSLTDDGRAFVDELLSGGFR